MSSISENVMASMFNHLTASYSPTDARVILKEKYPHAAEAIDGFEYDDTMLHQIAVGDALEANTTKLKQAVRTAKEKIAKAKADKAPKAESKMDKARAIFIAAEDQSRKAMIEQFTQTLGMSKAAASTYFYAVKKG